MQPIRTWIVIADGSKAHILVNEGPNKGVQFVPGTDFRHEILANKDIYADRPGRTHESAGPGRSAVEELDGQAQEKNRFAQRIAAFLRKKQRSKQFDRWVLVAPPEVLGDLRQHLDQELKETLVGEVSKDLTKVPTGKIPSHLTDILLL